MLTIVLPAVSTDTVELDASELRLEHSLVSLSKWESIYEKVFFGREEKTPEESLDYIRCMVLDEKPPENFLERLTVEHVNAIHDYINAKHTATTFRNTPSGKSSNEIITSDLVYYWLIQFQIPFACETWNFSRLMTLIQICGVKQTKAKRLNKQEAAAEQRRLNEQRRNELGTSG